jgi:hypothetical protein
VSNYSTAELLTLTIAGLTLVVAIVGVLYARLTLVRRELLIQAKAPTPLLHEVAGGAHIEVSFDQRTVAAPFVTVLEIRGNGRQAVTTGHFDQQRSIYMDLGAPIIGVLRQSGPRGDYFVSAEGSYAALGPDLVGPKDVVEVHLLTDGEPNLRPEHVRLDEHLIDTRCEYVPPGALPRGRRHRAIGLYAVGGAVFAAFMVALILLGRPHVNVRLAVTPNMVKPDGIVTVHATGLPSNSATLFFMGTERTVRCHHGVIDVHLNVPAFRPGRYIVVLQASYGGYGYVEKTAVLDVS